MLTSLFSNVCAKSCVMVKESVLPLLMVSNTPCHLFLTLTLRCLFWVLYCTCSEADRFKVLLPHWSLVFSARCLQLCLFHVSSLKASLPRANQFHSPIISPRIFIREFILT